MVNILILNAFLVIVCLSTSVSGDTLDLVQKGCSHLDMKEIQRLTALELSQIDDSRPHQVSLTCDGDSLRITTLHGPSQQVLERVIEMSDVHLRERIIALTVSQIVNAEIALSSSGETGMQTTPPTAAATFNENEQTDGVDRVAVSMGAGVKPHHGFSFSSGYGLIRTGIWFSESVGLISILSFEGGRKSQNLGSITALSGLAGLGVAWWILTSRHLNLELSSTASIGYTYLDGNRSRMEDVGSGDVAGVAGEFVVGLGGVLVAKGMLVALELLGGYTVENPVGTVNVDTEVSLGGFWLGGGLRIGFIKK